MTDPDMGTWMYAYDANGNLTSQTDAMGNIIRFTYDVLNRITLKDYPTGQQDVVYTYDANTVPAWNVAPEKNYFKGRLTKITDESGSTEMAYDNLGRANRLRKTVDLVVYDFVTEFDALGRKKSVAISPQSAVGGPQNETINYFYNPQGEIESIVSNVDGVIVQNVDYNASSQMTKVNYGNGTYTNYFYDSVTFRLNQLKTYSSVGTPLQNLSYIFDSVGNVLRIDDTVNTATQTFVYDDLNRLIESRNTNHEPQVYEYDSIGNMLRKGSTLMSYGQGNAGPHAVTAQSDLRTPNSPLRTFEYDSDGSMTRRGEDILEYDFDQKLKQISVKSYDLRAMSYELHSGWNLVSFPVLPSDKSIENIFGEALADIDQISKYNPSTDEWLHFVGEQDFCEFNSLEFGVGYEIYVSNPNGVTVTVLELLLVGKILSLFIKIETGE